MLDQHGQEDNDLSKAESIHLIGIAPRGLQTGLGRLVRLRRGSQQAQRRQRQGERIGVGELIEPAVKAHLVGAIHLVPANEHRAAGVDIDHL